jgi:hypothetical protein
MRDGTVYLGWKQIIKVTTHHAEEPVFHSVNYGEKPRDVNRRIITSVL